MRRTSPMPAEAIPLVLISSPPLPCSEGHPGVVGARRGRGCADAIGVGRRAFLVQVVGVRAGLDGDDLAAVAVDVEAAAARPAPGEIDSLQASNLVAAGAQTDRDDGLGSDLRRSAACGYWLA